MSKYIDRISKGDEEKKKGQLASAATRAKLQVQVDKIALAEAKSTAEAELEAHKEAVPFNLNNVVKATRKLANIDEDIKAAEAIETELFG